MRVSVLVSYRPDGAERDVLWSWVRARWESLFPEYEIIVEDDGLDPERGFNQGRAYNRAARKASGDIFLVTCPDVAFNQNTIELAVEQCAATGDWLLPERYCQLTLKDTKRLLRRRPNSRIPNIQRPERMWQEESVAEIAVVPAKAYHAVGGYDERYPRWGWIDKVFAVTMNTLYRPFRRYEGSMYHLWHSRPPMLPDSNSLLTKHYLRAEGKPRRIRELQRVA